ncbi:MAG: ABC transporter permease subunit [Anaerolineales bacterium]|jgi:ABC-type transport system involved in multi-copper enzyme maturation permease subunit
MFWTLISMEHGKNFRRLTLWIGLILISAFLAVSFIVENAYLADLQTQPQVHPDTIEEYKQLVTLPAALSTSLSFGASSGVLLVIIFVGTMTAQEYPWRTVNLLVGHGAPRFSLIAAKFLSFLLPVLGMVLVPLIVGGVCGGAATIHYYGGIDPTRVDFGRIGITVIGTVYSLLPYAAITFFLAVLTRSAAATIGISLGYFFILENLVALILWPLGGVWEKIGDYLPGVMAYTWISTLQASQKFNFHSAEFTSAVIGIAVYGLLFFLFSALIFRAQDLGG